MKVDGKELARNAARIKKNASLEGEGHVSNKEQEGMGAHIQCMMSLIEAIHHKDPEAAHKHIMEYSKHAVTSSPTRPQDKE